MNPDTSQIIKSKSQIDYGYSTVKITRSRIEKGLIAIPKSLAKWFPDHNTNIKIFMGDSSVLHNKSYSSYKSSTRECRIGGMAEWFKRNKIKPDDEIVIQWVDKENFVYRLIPEHMFIQKTHELQRNLDDSRDETEASDRIAHISTWTDFDKQKVAIREYHRMTNTVPIKDRRYVSKHSKKAKENIPATLRVLLTDIYRGHCQICDFWFLKKDNEPYFETHHLDPLKGNHPKNLKPLS